MLEGDKEERVELMTLLVRNLMKENKDLRHMLRLTASFIGEGGLLTCSRSCIHGLTAI